MIEGLLTSQHTRARTYTYTNPTPTPTPADTPFFLPSLIERMDTELRQRRPPKTAGSGGGGGDGVEDAARRAASRPVEASAPPLPAAAATSTATEEAASAAAASTSASVAESGSASSSESVPLSSSSSSSPSSSSSSSQSSPQFSCSICLDAPKDPVLTRCGHVYCWPCLHEWIKRSESCPVCKAGVTESSIIPIYSNNSDQPSVDPRTKPRSSSSSESTTAAPPRPRAERAPPPRQQTNFAFGGVGSPFNFGGIAPGASANFQAHIGFPFFSFAMNFGGPQNNNDPGGRRRQLSPEEQREVYISNGFLTVGLVFLLCFIFFL